VKEISEVEDHTEAVPVMVAEAEVEVVAATIAIKMATCLGNVPKADLEAEDVAVADSEEVVEVEAEEEATETVMEVPLEANFPMMLDKI